VTDGDARSFAEALENCADAEVAAVGFGPILNMEILD